MESILEQYSPEGQVWGLDPLDHMESILNTGDISFDIWSFISNFITKLLLMISRGSDQILWLVCGAVMIAFLVNLRGKSLHPEIMELAAIGSLGVPGVKCFMEIYREGLEMIRELNVLMLSSIPVMGAASFNPGTGVFAFSIQVLFILLSKILMPVILIYMILGICDSLSFDFKVTGLKNSSKTFFTWSLGVIMTAFTCITTITGVLSGAAGGVGVKTLKFTAASLIPVIGRYISESADMVINSAKLMSGAAGIGLMTAVIVVALMPFIKMLAYVILYRFAGVLVKCFAPGGVSHFIDLLADGYTMLMGLTGITGMVTIMNVSIFVSGI